MCLCNAKEFKISDFFFYFQFFLLAKTSLIGVSISFMQYNHSGTCCITYKLRNVEYYLETKAKFHYVINNINVYKPNLCIYNLQRLIFFRVIGLGCYLHTFIMQRNVIWCFWQILTTDVLLDGENLSAVVPLRDVYKF